MWSNLTDRRRLLLAGGGVGVAGLLIAVWALVGDAPASGTDVAPVEQIAVVLGNPNEPASVLTSRAVFPSSAAVVLVRDEASPEVVERSATLARERRVPLLDVGPTSAEPVRRELARLGVRSAVAVEPAGMADVGVRVDSASGSPEPAPVADPGSILVLIPAGPGSATAAATASAAGAVPTVVSRPDPMASGEAIDFVKRHPDARVIGIGGEFGTPALLTSRVEAAQQAPELPGGGYTLFPGRRMVALYGSPGAPALGPLGRQSLQESIARARRLAARYQPFSKEKVIPAFEIIVTVASASPGPGNKYTNVIDPKTIEPWVIEAGKAGVYVTLDLQPGRVDFLTQAKIYADLLKHPHVGLALDPEWRLKPNQVHLTQIGSVSAAEVNRVTDWLAELVRDNKLPQKLLVLHQFDSDMLANRDKINTGHPELAMMIHADGHGTPPVKMATWNRLIKGLSPDIVMGWKNFYTEDHPVFSPQRTMQVRPVPWFISYQ
ncbi:hypothetical protein GOARA_031_00030 [Gordonia araii NBRC 100433]|uniref:Uncharacterized protein n=1 Tax=Gordonia araii NBRC 100433 TaxID=1073574 RepID=G7H003_9ACTN|nr:hypothetical protein [Gordonia araii]GAB09178.1 hypothetical protein GOARA_031_00030 [Gordonia araii NBRC 100433]